MSRAADAVRESALVHAWDRGTLRVSGPDRATWLNGVLTCDVASVTPGRGALGLLLNKTGKIQADLVVVADGEALWLALPPARAAEALQTLERLLVMEDAEVADASADRAWLTLFGPHAAELAERLASEHGGASGAIGWSATPANALSLPKPALGAVLVALGEAGAVRASEEEFERFRVEHGIGVFGVDYDGQDNPHEAALDQRAVSWTKGCYLGQEVVCMQGMRGKVKRRLVRLALDAGPVPPPGQAVVSADGETLGQVTSAALSLSDARPVLLARVSGAALDSGASLSVGGAHAELLES